MVISFHFFELVAAKFLLSGNETFVNPDCNRQNVLVIFQIEGCNDSFLRTFLVNNSISPFLISYGVSFTIMEPNFTIIYYISSLVIIINKISGLTSLSSNIIQIHYIICSVANRFEHLC